MAEKTSYPVPFRTDSGLMKAEAQIEEGKYMQAIETLSLVIQRHPGDADAYTYIGFAYDRLGEKRRAAENYGRALKYNPRHLGANKYVADLYLETGDVQRAIEQLQVLKMVCGPSDCAEVNELEFSINKFRSGKEDPPTAPSSQ